MLQLVDMQQRVEESQILQLQLTALPRVAKNTVAAQHAAISGGKSNNIATAAIYGRIGGGLSNSVSGTYAVIGGGQSHTVSGNHGTVAGGSSNTASGTAATVSGGGSNTAGGSNAAVSGGSATRPTEHMPHPWWSHQSGCWIICSITVGENIQRPQLMPQWVADSNDATAASATISGGESNAASATHATVSGGSQC